MIRPGQVAIEREVLLDHGRAEPDRGGRYADPERVIRIADRQPEFLREREHRAQVHLIERRGILGRAVQQGQASA